MELSIAFSERTVIVVTHRLLKSFLTYAGPGGPVAPAKPRVQPPVKPQPAPLPPEPLWHVILLNDDLHSFEYVIEMLHAVFGYDVEKGYRMAREVDQNGRVIVATVHKELAELRLEQILEYGPDRSMPESPGSMQAEIQPAA